MHPSWILSFHMPGPTSSRLVGKSTRHAPCADMSFQNNPKACFSLVNGRRLDGSRVSLPFAARRGSLKNASEAAFG
jgi:hypothetical protein